MQNEQKCGTQIPAEADIVNCDDEMLRLPIPHLSHTSVDDSVVDKSTMNVDELLKFINGSDMEKNTKASRKAAKRARQKQRKVNSNVVKLDLLVSWLQGLEAVIF